MRQLARLCLFTTICLLTLAAQAQTLAPRYTLKELAKPRTARWCDTHSTAPRQLLNASGDVVLGCTYVGGIRFGAYNSNNFYNPFAIVEWFHDRPVVWPASGTPREMAFAKKSSIHQLAGITDAGQVYAHAVALSGSGQPLGVAQAHIWKQDGSRSLFQLPAGMPQGEWYLTAVTGAGRVALSSLSAPNFVFVTDGQLRPFPGLPPIQGLTGTFDLRFNNQDLFAASVETNNPASWTGKDLQPWFYKNGNWQRITPPEPATHVYVQDMNARGEVLAMSGGSLGFVWSAAGGSVKLKNLDGTWPAAAEALNDSGIAVGSVAPSQSSTLRGSRAAVWINSQAVDLNTTTTVPTNWVLERAIAINAKGQILVVGRDKSQTGSASTRYALLTPQQ